ncbi:MAG: cyclase family protein [Bacillota bacterium]
MQTYDITLSMSENLPGWPDHDSFEFNQVKSISSGDRCNLCEFKSSTHFGTHIDAPGHYVEEGKMLTDLDLNLLVGEVLLVEVESSGNITAEDLEALVPENTLRLLVKTGNSNFIQDDIFNKNYQAFTPEAMELIIRRGVKLLGIDYFSIAPYDDLIEPHKIYLGQGDTIALEGVDLSQVKAGRYELICLPLKIAGAFGAPARAILRDITH